MPVLCGRQSRASGGRRMESRLVAQGFQRRWAVVCWEFGIRGQQESRNLEVKAQLITEGEEKQELIKAREQD